MYLLNHAKRKDNLSADSADIVMPFPRELHRMKLLFSPVIVFIALDTRVPINGDPVAD